MTSRFERLWSKYLNDPDDGPAQQEALLTECLEAAENISDAIQVFNAAGRVRHFTKLPSRALNRMIELVQTPVDAQRVYSFASMRNTFNHFKYPTREKEARAKLESFAAAA